MEKAFHLDDAVPGIRRADYVLCVIAKIVFAFALAHQKSNPMVGWLFFGIFICFPTALRGENLGFSPIAFLALFIPGLNVVFALACLAFSQNFAETKKLDAWSVAWMFGIALAVLFWGLLWYQHWRAAQPLAQ